MAEQTPDTRSGGEVARLDLSKYRTAGLVEQVTELISVPRTALKVIGTALALAVAVVFTCLIIFYYSKVAGVFWLIGCAYSLVVGFALGVVLGLLRVLTAALQNIESILRLMLNIATRAADDYEQVQSGGTQMPSGGELVEQVYDDVLLPTLERAAARAFGPVSGPMLWAYRRSIGSAVRYLIKLVHRGQLTEQREQQIETTASSGLEAVARYSERIQVYAAKASELVGTIGKNMRFYAVRPLYVLFALALLGAVLPLLILRYLGMEQPP